MSRLKILPIMLLLIFFSSSTLIAATYTECYQEACAIITVPDNVVANEDFEVTVEGYLEDGSSWDTNSHMFLENSEWSYDHNNMVRTSAAPLDAGHPAVQALANARTAFWTSGTQFETFSAWVPADCEHACRYGKTYDALAAEGFGAGVDQVRVVHRGGVDADLVRAGKQHLAHVIDRANAAADRERDEDLLGGLPDNLVGRLPVTRRGGDVQEGDLVGALLVVTPRDLYRIACVADIHETHALHDAALVNIKAGNDPNR